MGPGESSGDHGVAVRAAVDGAPYPSALTRFVGRDQEIDRLTRLLASRRLVTVTGPGGIGKSRMVAEAVQRMAAAPETPVWVVELAPLEDANHLHVAVAARLGCQERPGVSVLQSIVTRVKSEPGLLILDNCEHLCSEVARLGTDLLTVSDELSILTTSREPIGVPGEALLRLRPLSTTSSGDNEAPASAVHLFEDRASLADPEFRVTPDTAAQVARIVTRLDGLPLAIELAAARCESLGLTGLEERLRHQPLAILESGARATPSRHRSLRATIDWSYRLLSDAQQRVLRQLSVFSVPFTLDGAEAVGGVDTLAVLPSLVDCSLVNPPAVFADGQPRYSKLQGVADFARELLVTEGAEQQALEAMAVHATSVAERAASDLFVAGGEEHAAVLFDIEDPLLHSALRWAREHDSVGAPTLALRLALALAPWWQLRGRAVGGYRLLHEALAGREQGSDLAVRAQIWLGRLAHGVGNWNTALQHFDSAWESTSKTDPSEQLVDVLNARSGTLRNVSRLVDATENAHAALGLAVSLGYPEGTAHALLQLSLAASYAGDEEAAIQWATDAAGVDASAVSDRTRRRIALAVTMIQCGAGRLQLARRTCSEGLESARRSTDVNMQADFLYFMTHIALQAADYDQASGPISESLQIAAQAGDRLRLLDCLEDCARLCAATDHPAEALTLWAVRRAQGRANEMPDTPANAQRRDGAVRQARRRLGPEPTEMAEHRGALMSLEAAVELAAAVLESGRREDRPPIASQLTPRERQLLQLLANGHTDAEIASDLFISIRTVRSHLDRIRTKTGSRRRAELTRLAVELGLV